MFKRLLLTLILIVTLSRPIHLQAATPSAYRALADTYLAAAVTYALNTYQSATASNSGDALAAYVHSLYSTYFAQASAQLDQFGNPALAKIYSLYSYLYGYYAQSSGLAALLKSSGANANGAYLSYLYNYLGYLYSYLDYLQR